MTISTMIVGTSTVTRNQHQHQRHLISRIQYGTTCSKRRIQSTTSAIVLLLLVNTTYLYHYQHTIISFVTATSSSGSTTGSSSSSSSSRGATGSGEASSYLVSETSSSHDKNINSLSNTIIPINDISDNQQPPPLDNSNMHEDMNNDIVVTSLDTRSVEESVDIADEEKIVQEHDYDMQQQQEQQEQNELNDNDNDDCCPECEYYDAMYTNNDDDNYQEQAQQQQQNQEIDKYNEELYYQQNQNQEYTTSNGNNNQYPISGGEQQKKKTATVTNNNNNNSGIQSYTDPTVRKNSRQVLDAIIGRTAIPIVGSLIITTIMNSIDPILQRHLLIGMLSSSSSSSNSHNLLSSTSTSTTSSTSSTTPVTTSVVASRTSSDTVNHCFLFLLSILNYIPTITASMVATAVGTGNYTIAQEYVSSSLFVCYFFGTIATYILFYKPHILLQLILPNTISSSDSSSTTYNEIIQSLRIRAISIIPILISSSAFAGFRGSLDTITPFKVSLITQFIKLTLQPLLSLSKKFDKIGYDLAISISDVCSGLLYIFLMTKRRLLQLQLSIKIPSIKSLTTLIGGGLCLFSRQTILNIIFLFATNRAQQIQIQANAQQSVLSTTNGSAGSTSSTAVLEAIAYSIVNKVYFSTSVVHIGMQATAATLVPFIITKFGLKDAQYMAERINVWGTILGMVVGIVQYISMPYILLLYIGDNSNSKLSSIDRIEIQSKVMSLTSFLSLFHIFNGSIAVGEGTMIGLGNYIELILISLSGLVLIGSIIQYTQLGQSLVGIGCSIVIYYFYQTIIITLHRRYFSPLKHVSTEKLQQKSYIRNDDERKEDLKL